MKPVTIDISEVVFNIQHNLDATMLRSLDIKHQTFINIVRDYFTIFIDEFLINIVSTDNTLKQICSVDAYSEYSDSAEQLTIIDYPSYSSVVKVVADQTLAAKRTLKQFDVIASRLIATDFTYEQEDIAIISRRGNYLMVVTLNG